MVLTGVLQRQNVMFKLGSQPNPNGEVWDHKGKTELVQIFISYGSKINFLQYLHVENGTLVLSERLGGSDNGNNFNTVRLNYPDEFLTSISGSYHTEQIFDGFDAEDHVMTSITFGTNQGSHGPFGEPGKYDSKFNFQMGQDRPFGGFHGSTKDGLLESIGVYVKPLETLSDLKCAEDSVVWL
ncbi:unnamed protein product [Camellia sinensis]